MNNRWFTSDQHFDHPWIAGWRGYNSVTQMDQDLVARWNDIIDGGDVVYILGDFYWGKHSGYINNIITKLKGNKIWIKGNHDRWFTKKGIKCGAIPYRRLKHSSIKVGVGSNGLTIKQHFVMCHYPMWTWHRKDYGSIHLHGHSHGKTMPRVNMLDVGLDSAKIILGEYRPFSLDEVLYLTTTTKPDSRY